MFTVRKVVPALCLAVSMSGLAVYAATTTNTPTAAPGPGGHHWQGHHHGFMGMVLHKLNLTDAQKAQVKTIMTSEKSQFEALRTSSQANHEALGEHLADRYGDLCQSRRDGAEECCDAHPAAERDLDAMSITMC